MVDNINTNTMMGKVVAVCIALLFIVVLAFPVANSLSNGGNGGDETPFNEGSIGAKLDYYTTSPTAKTVEVTNDGTNIVLSGDYSDTYPVSDMVLMASDKQSLCVKDGVMFYNDGTTTVPTESVTLTLNSSGLNGKTYEWVYFPTVDGAYGCYINGYDHANSDAVSVASFNGISVILKNGNVIDAPFDVTADPNTVDGKVVNYDIKGEQTLFTDGLWQFYLRDNNAVIDRYIGTDTVSVLEVPSTVSANGVNYTVTGIYKSDAMIKEYENQAIVSTDVLSDTSLVLPNTLTFIGEGAFNSCYGLTGSLVIPDSVTSIGGNAFYNCSGLTGSLVIPDSVTYIGSSAFESCSGFTGLTLGDSVTTIGDSAFAYCTGFTGTLVLPDSVTSIGNHAFRSCSGFTSLTLGNSVQTIGENVFHDCSGFTGSLVIPDSVTTIGNEAFSSCSEFTSLTLGNNVQTIGERAFTWCSGLTSSLVIPDSVTYIGSSAFEYCSGFNGSLVIPNSVTTIGHDIIANTNLTIIAGQYTQNDWNFDILNGGITLYKYSGFFADTITIPNSLTVNGTAYPVTAIGNNVEPVFKFYSAVKIIFPDTLVKINQNTCIQINGKLTLPNSVTYIGDYAFYTESNYLSGELVIPDSVTYIGNHAFDGAKITSLTLGNSVQYIGDYAFSQCNKITGTLTIPDSVTTIGDGAFQNCSGLTGSLVLPDSVTSIGNHAFRSCSGFTSLTLGNSVQTIGENAFYYCSGFTGTLVIPDSMTSIGEYAFGDCTGFTGSLVIPDSVTYIGSSAFSGCSGFSSLTLGNSVQTIGENAFYYCSGFTGSLVIPDSVTTIGNEAFSGCSEFTGSLTIGDSVTTIGGNAFESCSEFTSLTLGNSVQTIGNSAFYNCSGLTGSLVIPDSVTTIGNYAFQSCSGFTGALIIPDSVMFIGENAFDGCENLTILVNGSSADIQDYTFDNTNFVSVLNIGNANLDSSFGIDSAIVKDKLTTAGTIQMIGGESGSGSDSPIGGVASTLIKLVPILLIVSLLLVFIVPMVYKPN